MNLPATQVLADSAFSAQGAASPRPDGGKRFIVETGRPFSRSHIWQLQDAYFAGRGVEAWRQGEVPHYVTSNPTIANAYAEIVFAFRRDLERLAGSHDDPLTICELGAGSGRFAFHFLRRLEHLCARADVAPEAFRYVLTDVADSVPWPMLVRLSILIFVPDAGRDWLPTRPRKPNPAGPPEPAVGAWVTVTSVPTPYSECSTVVWAFLTPEAAAVTVITKPIPRARPRAMKIACRIRRRNSRRR